MLKFRLANIGLKAVKCGGESVHVHPIVHGPPVFQRSYIEACIVAEIAILDIAPSSARFSYTDEACACSLDGRCSECMRLASPEINGHFTPTKLKFPRS